MNNLAVRVRWKLESAQSSNTGDHLGYSQRPGSTGLLLGLSFVLIILLLNVHHSRWN